MYGMEHGLGWGMGYGWFFMILFWVLIIVVIAYFIKTFASGGRKSAVEDSPLEILKKRYAKGEISKSDFDKMKKDLQ